jgi:hypothetical protein
LTNILVTVILIIPKIKRRRYQKRLEKMACNRLLISNGINFVIKAFC